MDKNTKVIFLDFDGVLNTMKGQGHLRRTGGKWYDDYGEVFDPEAVENLKMVLDAVPDAILVISSSWKMDGLQRMRAMWHDRALPGKIHSITPDPVLENVDLSNPDIISTLAGKGGEIKAWIDKYAPDGCRYVIFDDSRYFFDEQMPHLVRTHPMDGILEEDAVRAIDLLTKDI